MMDSSEKSKVLIVDDAPEHIQVLMETLKDEYTIVAAINGEKALELAASEPVPDIILLDIMMPGMDGYEVCSRLKAQAKTSKIPVIFVTAMDQVENETAGFAIGAVDYVTKPISPPIVRARVKTHLSLRHAQQRLQDLLKKTLGGSVRVLVDILSLANPAAFSRSSQLRQLVKEMSINLGLNDIWKLELAAMLSQIGCVTLPAETLNKLYAGEDLTEEEREQYAGYAARGAELIAHIPHLESVAGMIARIQEPLGWEYTIEPRKRDAVIIGGQLLQITTDYIQHVNSGMSPESVIQQMNNGEEKYDLVLVNTLERVLGIKAQELSEKTVTVKDIFSGMILNQDVYSEDGTLLAVNGTELAPATVKIIQHHSESEGIKGPIRVFAPKDR